MLMDSKQGDDPPGPALLTPFSPSQDCLSAIITVFNVLCSFFSLNSFSYTFLGRKMEKSAPLSPRSGPGPGCGQLESIGWPIGYLGVREARTVLAHEGR